MDVSNVAVTEKAEPAVSRRGVNVGVPVKRGFSRILRPVPLVRVAALVRSTYAELILKNNLYAAEFK